MTQSNLMKMEYFDLKSETRLETYADTVVIEKENNYFLFKQFQKNSNL